MMLLELENLTKIYQRRNVLFQAVNGVELAVDRGEMVAICGESGSGKSTLFHMIAGLEKPDKGHIYYEGKDIAAMTRAQLAKYRNCEIGYVIQGQSVLKNFSVLENVCLPYYISGAKDDVYERGMELLKKVNLEQYADSYPQQLSGGEMRRVAIARALINKPKLVIADEPTSNLDVKNARYMMELLYNMHKEGISIVFSTHDDLYKDYVEKAVIMNKGSVTNIMVS